MSLKDRLKKKKAQIKKRHQEQREKRKSQENRGSIFIRSKMPKGVKFWKPEKDTTHIVDVLPWELKEAIPEWNLEKGDFIYVLDVWVHNNIGPNRSAFVCPSRTFGEPCPVCEQIMKKLSKGRLEDKEYKALPHPKHRTIYQVWVHTTDKEENEGPMIWDVSYGFFEEEIVELSESPKGGGANIDFSDPWEGKMIAFRVKREGSFIGGDGKKYDGVKFKGHRFLDRAEEIPDEILEKTVPLETMVKLRVSYKEIQKMLGTMPENDEDEDEEQDDSPFYDNGDESGEDENVGGDEDDEKYEETITAHDECPDGHEFGIDTDKYDECVNCEKADDCQDEFDRRLMKERKEKRKKTKSTKERPKEEKKDEAKSEKKVRRRGRRRRR